MADEKLKAKAKNWMLVEASTGTPGVAIEFAMTDPELAGQTMDWTGWLSDAAYARTVESLRYCGWRGDNLEELTGLDANEVELVVGDEEYEGKKYKRVKFVNRIGGLALKTPLAGDKAKSFAASMRDKIRALDAAKGQKAQPAPKPAAPQPSDKNFDVPF